MIYMNGKMRDLMNDIDRKKGRVTPKTIELNSIMRFLWPRFIEIEECIFVMTEVGSQEKMNFDSLSKMFGDKTGIEAFFSHQHMMDIIKEFSKRPKDGFRFSLKLMEMWACKLKNTFPNYKFHLVLFFDGKDSILRYYRLRDSEPAWCDKNDLEMQRAAVMIQEI